MDFRVIDTVGAVVVLGTIGASLAIIFAAFMVLRPHWRDGWRNGLVLAVLIAFLLLSLRTFSPGFLRREGPFVPGGTELLLCFVLPLTVYALMLFTWPYMRTVSEEMPVAWTIWPQTFRSIGGLFLIYWAAGHMPAGFALPAGIGDLLVGCTAPFVTRAVLRGAASRTVLIGWNLLGILDFIVAFATGFTFNTPTEYPLVLIPGFLVPIAIMFHLFSLRRLGVLANPGAMRPERAW